MKCKKCKKKNVRQAKFCYKCGNKFTKDEINEAMNKGLIVKILKLKDWYDTITLSKITGSIYYKIASILLVLGIGVFFIINNGSKFKIMDNNTYSYKYNSKYKEYYIYPKSDNLNLSLYLPHEVDNIYLKSYNNSNELLNTEEIKDISNMKIELNNNDIFYYKLSLSKKENNKNTIKFYVLGGE